MLSIGRTNDHATASGKHTGGPRGQRVYDFLFDIPEFGFAFALKELANGAAQTRFNGMV
jgi:hypothetical protein